MIPSENDPPFNKLTQIPLQNIKLTDSFWKKRQEINKNVSLPMLLKKLEKDNHVNNFRVAAGIKEGIHLGDFYFDSDLYKWLEGALYFSRFTLPSNLEEKIEEIINLIEKAQLNDGYLNTYYSTKFLSKRFTNLLIFHELYCAGHLIEAAIAQYEMTRDSKLLKIAKQFADLLVKKILLEDMKDTCGHPEIEMALIKLYRHTKNKKYLKLCKYLIDMRGKIPHFKTYVLRRLIDSVKTFNQAKKIKKNFISEYGMENLPKEEAAEFLEDFTLKEWITFLRANFNGKMYQLNKPVRDLYEPVGHAVRALYLYSGIADLYSETGEKALLHSLQLIWLKMKKARMYITGGVGSISSIEGFDKDFRLKAEDSYSETCAAIANIMWNWRMFLITANGKYTDLIETLLYNAMLVGQSLDGKKYFYSNPLISYGTEERKEWFKCPCCPTNFIRKIPILEQYIYAKSEEGIWVNQHIGSEAKISLKNGAEVLLNQESQFPWKGDISIQISLKNDKTFSIFLRIPKWCGMNEREIYVNGKKYKKNQSTKNYIKIQKNWVNGDKIKLIFKMKPKLMQQNPHRTKKKQKVAISYGPLIYCLEQKDNNQIDIINAHIAEKPELIVKKNSTLINDMTIIQGKLNTGQNFTAIPYFAGGNRGPNKMRVWLDIE